MSTPREVFAALLDEYLETHTALALEGGQLKQAEAEVPRIRAGWLARFDAARVPPDHAEQHFSGTCPTCGQPCSCGDAGEPAIPPAVESEG